MRKPESTLNLKELEELCNLYIDCRLSPVEEKELEFVLLNTSLSSPLISDVKKIMVFEEGKIFKYIVKTKGENNKILGNYKIKAVAASLLILITCIGGLLKKYDYATENETIYCQVYSNGKLLDKEESLAVANENIEKIKVFEEKIKSIEIQENRKIENFINNTSN